MNVLITRKRDMFEMMDKLFPELTHTQYKNTAGRHTVSQKDRQLSAVFQLNVPSFIPADMKNTRTKSNRGKKRFISAYTSTRE